MKWIAEEDKPGYGLCSGRDRGDDVRGGTAAHRLAADEQMLSRDWEMLLCCRNRRLIAGNQFRHPIRNITPLLHVEEVECEHVDAAPTQSVRERHHERMPLSRAGAMREHQRGPWRRRRCGAIERAGRALATFEFDVNCGRKGINHGAILLNSWCHRWHSMCRAEVVSAGRSA